MTEFDDADRARALAEFGQELHELERALDELVTDSISDWLEGVSIEVDGENGSNQPIDPAATRAFAERVLAASAAAELLDRICDSANDWEADLRGQVYSLRRKACLDLLMLGARSDEA